MTTEEVLTQFRETVDRKIAFVPDGIGRYRVSTPFRFDDGDHFSICLKREGDTWILSDEGTTYMHLSYDLDESGLMDRERQAVISNALSQFGVDDHNGELKIVVRNGECGDALSASFRPFQG